MADLLTVDDLPEESREALLAAHPHLASMKNLQDMLVRHVLKAHAEGKPVFVKSRALVRVGVPPQQRIVLASQAHGRGVTVGHREWHITPEGDLTSTDHMHPCLPLEEQP